MSTLVYYFLNGDCETFKKYTINSRGVIVHTPTGIVLDRHIRYGYNMAVVSGCDGTPRVISVARAVASTFLGRPAKGCAVEHADQNTSNDRVDNIHWACP
jgi:hypothetical protein